ncbi:MAG: lipopolysaccharide biosynthesis protein [Eubacterium sp.]
MRKINQLKAGVFLSYFQMALNVIIGIVYTPLMLRLLGQSEFGVYSTAGSVLSALAILDMGFSSSYIRFYSKYKINGEKEKISKLNGVYITIFSIIGGITLLCGLIISNNLTLVFKDGLTPDEMYIARVLLILMSFNAALDFPLNTFISYISANEKYLMLKLLGVIRTVIAPLMIIPTLMAGYGSIGMVTVNVSICIIAYICYIAYSIKTLDFRISFTSWEKGIFKSLFAFSGLIALNMIVDQINNNIDRIILSRYCGAAVTAVYSVGGSLHSYYINFSTSISGVFAPRTHRLVNEYKDNPAAQRKALTELFVKVGRIQFLVLALICSGLVFFGKQFIYYWAGEGYTQAYYVALVMIIPGTVPLIQNVGIEIQRAQNKHHYRAYIYFAMALVNLGLSIYLAQIYGAVGAAVGTGLSSIIACGIIMNIVYHKKINIDVIVFWKNILSQAKGIIIPCIVGALIMRFVEYKNIFEFIACIAVYSLVYGVSVWFLSMNKYEKGLVISALNKILRRG